jgi:heat shock protein HtpX
MASKNLYDYQSANVRRTWLLFVVFFVVVVGIGYVFSQAYGDPNFIYFALIFSVVYSLISYYSSAKIALSLARAKPVSKQDNPMLYNIVENLCIADGLTMPALYVTPELQINAFATGRDPQHAAVAVTQGALNRLDKSELQGVLAHELSHVKNRDILVSTVAAILAGIISLVADIFLRSFMFGGMRGGGGRNNEAQEMFFIFAIVLSILAPIGTMLIQLAISRRREALADASGVLLTRYPEGLISALQKIEADNTPMASAKDSTAHMWITNPFKGKASWWHNLFATHPPIEQRIAALRALSS